MTTLSVSAVLYTLVPLWSAEDVLRAYRVALCGGHAEAAVFEAELRRRLAASATPGAP